MVIVLSLTVITYNKPADSVGLRAIGGGHEMMRLEAFPTLQKSVKRTYFEYLVPNSF